MQLIKLKEQDAQALAGFLINKGIDFSLFHKSSLEKDFPYLVNIFSLDKEFKEISIKFLEEQKRSYKIKGM